MDASGTVWSQTLDNGVYKAVVTSLDNPYSGTLELWLVEGAVKIMSEPVGIAYGAPFGPDAADVGLWQDMILEWLDKYEQNS